MKKTLILLAVAIGLTACGGVTTKKQADTLPADVTQVLYFHGKQRCMTCNAIEKLTKEVVDSLADDKIVMKVIDITTNEALADKYEVTWSSLILDHNGKIENLTDIGFSYAKREPEVFKNKLAEAIHMISK